MVDNLRLVSSANFLSNESPRPVFVSLMLLDDDDYANDLGVELMLYFAKTSNLGSLKIG
jgi:hypothetical protein